MKLSKMLGAFEEAIDALDKEMLNKALAIKEADEEEDGDAIVHKAEQFEALVRARESLAMRVHRC